jgi:hypothetical protein
MLIVIAHLLTFTIPEEKVVPVMHDVAVPQESKKLNVRETIATIKEIP